MAVTDCIPQLRISIQAEAAWHTVNTSWIPMWPTLTLKEFTRPAEVITGQSFSMVTWKPCLNQYNDTRYGGNVCFLWFQILPSHAAWAVTGCVTV